LVRLALPSGAQCAHFHFLHLFIRSLRVRVAVPAEPGQLTQLVTHSSSVTCSS